MLYVCYECYIVVGVIALFRIYQCIAQSNAHDEQSHMQIASTSEKHITLLATDVQTKIPIHALQF